MGIDVNDDDGWDKSLAAKELLQKCILDVDGEKKMLDL